MSATLEEEKAGSGGLPELTGLVDGYRLGDSPVYMIEDVRAAERVVNFVELGDIPYGIEFGPGALPSNLPKIDASVKI